MNRALCIAVHDIAPATWPESDALFDLLRDVGSPPATLLVVPDYHGRGRVEDDRAFVRTIDARIAKGDEIALHGYRHVDDGPAPHGAYEWWQRRHLTASEGEFAALTECDAEMRLRAGLAMFERLRWNAAGFVAPAWLLGAGARAALARIGLRYTSTLMHLESLADGRRIVAPAISASARHAWRRWTSRQWLGAARIGTRRVPLLRIVLHPADAHDPRLMQAWRTLLEVLLADRTALTKSDAIAAALARGHAAWTRA